MGAISIFQKDMSTKKASYAVKAEAKIYFTVCVTKKKFVFWKKVGNTYLRKHNNFSMVGELQICTIMQLTLNMNAIVDLPPLGF